MALFYEFDYKDFLEVRKPELTLVASFQEKPQGQNSTLRFQLFSVLPHVQKVAVIPFFIVEVTHNLTG
jgi:hypothetical protein